MMKCRSVPSFVSGPDINCHLLTRTRKLSVIAMLFRIPERRALCENNTPG